MTTMIFTTAFCPATRAQVNWEAVQTKAQTTGVVLSALLSSGFVLSVLAHAFYAVS